MSKADKIAKEINKIARMAKNCETCGKKDCYSKNKIKQKQNKSHLPHLGPMWLMASNFWEFKHLKNLE